MLSPTSLRLSAYVRISSHKIRRPGRAPAGGDHHGPGGDRNPGVHARGDLCHGEDPDPGGPARNRRRHHLEQHLPSLPAARGSDHRGPGGAAPLHALGRPHPHRLRRLPDLQPGVLAHHERGGRDLPVASGRLQPFPHPGDRGGPPGGPGGGHHDLPG